MTHATRKKRMTYYRALAHAAEKVVEALKDPRLLTLRILELEKALGGLR